MQIHYMQSVDLLVGYGVIVIVEVVLVLVLVLDCDVDEIEESEFTFRGADSRLAWAYKLQKQLINRKYTSSWPSCIATPREVRTGTSVSVSS